VERSQSVWKKELMAEVENLVLDPLRHMRGQLDPMEHKLEDVIARLDHVERSVAEHSVQLAEINRKLDRLDVRATRIEKRLPIAAG
jgi:archaellum component FlaC